MIDRANSPGRHTVVALVAVLVALACRAPAERVVHQGPIVLITIDALRADVLGVFGGRAGTTPAMDELARQADLAVRAVSASSWTVPSMASLMTGLQPWRHGSWDSDRAWLESDLETLAEALQEAGYQTNAFRSNHWLTRTFNYQQGFDSFGSLGQGKRAAAQLRSLDGSRQFVWVHILPPHSPYVRHDELLQRLGIDPEGLPEKVRAADLEPYFDPAVALPDDVKQRFWSLYLAGAAWADAQVGALLEALRQSGHWDDSLVVVTADHGEEFGEAGQIAHGGNLHRALIEVPLLVKLPAAWPEKPARDRVVANHRLFATVLRMAGATPPAGTAPSLFAPDDNGALSELYHGNGVNLFSLVEGANQVVWTARFAPPHRDYYAARLGLLLDDEAAAERAGTVFAAVRQSFLAVPPLSGLADERPQVERWTWGQEVTADDAEERRMIRALPSRWKALNGAELPPGEALTERAGDGGAQLTAEDEAALRALGYVTR